jgi:hypothetical protein
MPMTQAKRPSGSKRALQQHAGELGAVEQHVIRPFDGEAVVAAEHLAQSLAQTPRRRRSPAPARGRAAPDRSAAGWRRDCRAARPRRGPAAPCPRSVRLGDDPQAARIAGAGAGHRLVIGGGDGAETLDAKCPSRPARSVSIRTATWPPRKPPRRSAPDRRNRRSPAGRDTQSTASTARLGRSKAAAGSSRYMTLTTRR